MQSKILASLLLCFFLFFSCSSEKWKYDRIENSSKYASSRLCYQNAPNSSFGLEFLCIREKVYSYLSLLSPGQDSTLKTFSLFIEGIEYKRSGKGFDKILLDEETSLLLVNSLKDEKTIKIQLDGEEETISPKSFGKSYEKFLHPSRVEKVLNLFF